MTVQQAIGKSATYRLLIIRNVLRAMDRWGASEWRKDVLTVQMARVPDGVAAFPPPGPLGIRSGDLSKTVRTDPARYLVPNFKKTLRAGDGKVRYARIHEYGGMTGRGHSVYIPKRPYMKPAFERTRGRLKTLVEESCRAAGREAYGR